jgi:hypothetical protein
MTDKITEIFFCADEFCKEYYKVMEGHLLTDESSKKKRNKPCRLSDSEVITIMIAFHLGGYRNLKQFYIKALLYQLCAEVSQIRISQDCFI